MHSTKPYVVLVLAAGESSRYGGVKQLAEISGRPLLRQVVENLIAPEIYELIVVLGANRESIKPVIHDLHVGICENTEWKSGMSSSLKAGHAFMQSNYPQAQGMVVVLADQWMISKEHIKRLLHMALQHPHTIVATNYAGKPGVPVYFPKVKWHLFASLAGDEGARKFLEAQRDVILLDIPEAHFDLDTPDEIKG